jgi:hypothetical protein
MLGYAHNCNRIMTISNKSLGELSEEEFKEMDDLRKAISQNPSYVHPDKQERFTELFVRSLSYVGNI